jgi:hypothetical protein
LCYSLSTSRVKLTPEQKALDPGYPDPPAYQTIYYKGRGTEFFNGSHLFDLAVTYDVPIIKTVRPWIKASLFNIFNSQPLIGYDIAVTPDANGPKDALGLATNYVKGSKFGNGTSNTHYPTPREFNLMMGVRF